MSNSVEPTIMDEWNHLKMDVLTSLYYHRSREKFFNGTLKSLQVVTFLSAVGMLAAATKGAEVPTKIFGSMAIAFVLLQPLLGLSDIAKKHRIEEGTCSTLFNRMSEDESRSRETFEYVSKELLLSKARLDMSFLAVRAVARNTAFRALSNNHWAADPTPVSRLQYLFRHISTFSNSAALFAAKTSPEPV